jgi:hypothetical protein
LMRIKDARAARPCLATVSRSCELRLATAKGVSCWPWRPRGWQARRSGTVW